MGKSGMIFNFLFSKKVIIFSGYNIIVCFENRDEDILKKNAKNVILTLYFIVCNLIFFNECKIIIIFKQINSTV